MEDRSPYVSLVNSNCIPVKVISNRLPFSFLNSLILQVISKLAAILIFLFPPLVGLGDNIFTLFYLTPLTFLALILYMKLCLSSMNSSVLILFLTGKVITGFLSLQHQTHCTCFTLYKKLDYLLWILWVAQLFVWVWQ